ncbi:MULTISPECIES: bifunctional acetate--CoA ligase family protein/GNAT family N-acetyltransferase [unclassified Sphingomonas]|uniref:bifunctional acetate--CoA ligase family protein/GNAT family N-acetyltransferase n=1 Tax=unclassified Sphingomonas TaxID=196159 RepID=UPI000700A606|nr:MULTISPECIES: acetate--CoA ligase family protein [unclassified Sphingomonas]KQX23285.1 CoA-binding protein [Sphingomonas sp. Root1294]KQY68133.1 CoA-binding protein [Sphingomonas sp. Root50]KRB91026.1 CoA-binding protein [Sphingomonas sp. Root720]
MSIRDLQSLLHARSVVVVGGSSRPGSLGSDLLANIAAGGFRGPIFAVNPNPVEASGVRWFASIEALPEVPDLALIVTPAATVAAIVEGLGRFGVRVAVILSAGFEADAASRAAILDRARACGVRLIGPNTLGLIAPGNALNASFALSAAKPGGLALVSQSGAIIAAMIDWAAHRPIGFSGIVSVGDMVDVDLGDLIDLFAVDPATDAILLYLEQVTAPEKFISAARAAARLKPVIAIKAGRTADGAAAARSHTGALAGSAEVYEAVLERCGVVLVDSLTGLLDAAEVTAKLKPPRGNRVAIMTNGGGAGILAADALGDAGAVLSPLDAVQRAQLDAILPPAWSRGNPVDLLGDAGPARYGAALKILLGASGTDALLLFHCPTRGSAPMAVAEAVAAEVRAARAAGSRMPVIACWLGAPDEAVRGVLAAAGIPLFTTPDDSVRAFGYLLAAGRAQAGLVERQPARGEVPPDRAGARRLIAGVRQAGRTQMTEIEAKALLAAYGVPIIPTRFAAKAENVLDACTGLAPPYAVKIVSPDLTHKADVGGVALGLSSGSTAATAAFTMAERVHRLHPEARIEGFAVETMSTRPQAIELIAGIANDPTFGPVILFGAGGHAVEIIDDKALGLPPLDRAQAEAMIDRTRVARQLRGYRTRLPSDMSAIVDTLCALSAIAVDHPEILELDINPLIADADGVMALDARAVVSVEVSPASRLVIRPVPVLWSADLVTRSGAHIHVRPVVPEDEALLAEMFRHVSAEDLRFRFLSSLREVDHDHLAMMTQVDYRRTISFVALASDGAAIAVAMLAADADRSRAEVALSTRSDWKGQGVSYTLLEHVLRYATAEGIATLEAIESADHDEAITLERDLGFEPRRSPDDPSLKIVRRVLTPSAA